MGESDFAETSFGFGAAQEVDYLLFILLIVVIVFIAL